MNATVMAVQLFCVVALAALAASAPVPRTTRQTQAVLSYILNAARGNYLEIAESGEIDANGDFGSEAAQFYVTYLGNSLRAQSALYPDKFMVFVNGELRVEVPSGDNDLFEIVELGEGWKALRAPSHSVGSGVSSEESDLTANSAEQCFVGFSEGTGAFSCYGNSTDDNEPAATRLYVVPDYW